MPRRTPGATRNFDFASPVWIRGQSRGTGSITGRARDAINLNGWMRMEGKVVEPVTLSCSGFSRLPVL